MPSSPAARSPRLPSLTSALTPALVPVLICALLAGWLAIGLLHDGAARADRLAVLAGVTAAADVVDALGDERAATDRLATGADPDPRSLLDTARGTVDTGLGRAVGYAAAADDPQARALVRTLGEVTTSLQTVRSHADTGAADAQEYDRLAADLVAAVTGTARGLPAPAAALAVEQAGLLLTISDAAAAERDLGKRILEGDAAAGDATRRSQLATAQLAATAQWAQITPGADSEHVLWAVPDTAGWTVATARTALDAPRPTAAGLSPQTWQAVADAQLTRLTSARGDALDNASAAIEASGRKSDLLAATAATLAALALAAAVGLAMLQLRARTVAVDPRGASPADHVVPLDPAVAVAVAPHVTAYPAHQVQQAHQAATVAGNEALVNIARRNQVLLGRQLSLIDALERGEEDPDALANLYRLDHLATRMRRNAESLLVLAGVDAGRRLREPLRLSGVLRAASAEIEHYERVDLSVRTDPRMLAHAALPVAHLLAELMENAARFSESSTRVRVDAAPAAGGVRVTVTDEGLGMTAHEIAAALHQIASPPAGAVAQARLGFHVVGRLAHRLGAMVGIRPADGGGLSVTVDLPSSLLEASTATTGDEVASLPRQGSHAVKQQGGAPLGAPPLRYRERPAAHPQPPDVPQGPPMDPAPPTSTLRSLTPSPLPPAALIPPPAPSLTQRDAGDLDTLLDGSALPRRRARRAMFDAEVHPSLHPEALGPPMDAVSRRAVLASEALSELSMLSSYRPEATSVSAAPLAHRERGRTGESTEPAAAPSQVQLRPRDRSPAGVRTLLSGFAAGVDKARTGPVEAAPPLRAGVAPPLRAGSGTAEERETP